MTNEEYAGAVMRGEWPTDPAVPLPVGFVNGAGLIQNLALQPFEGAAIIESAPGSIRSNHWHKTDWHYLYVLTGEVWYYWRKVGSTAPPEKKVFGPGQMFFTPPGMVHATFFPVHTTLISLSRHSRGTVSHEADLVREKLIEVRDAEGTLVVSTC